MGWIDFYLIPRTNDKTIGWNINIEVEEEKARDGVKMETMVKRGKEKIGMSRDGSERTEDRKVEG